MHMWKTVSEKIHNEKGFCTGCTACMNICPNQAVCMQKNDEGFIEAYIDETKCSDCGRCGAVCHLAQVKTIRDNRTPLYYAAFSKDFDNVEHSSSGGIFYEFCKSILQQSGVVYGAVQESVFEVSHKRGTNLEETALFRRSKYLESQLGNCYKEVEQDLREGRKVLFSGVGCQIAGLYCYLQNEYENLYTCEVVCHGVPSYLAYEKYLAEKSKRCGDQICAINFRDKRFGWKNNAICETFASGKSDISYSSSHELHAVYLKGINMRKNCGSCRYAQVPRIADITLADFWQYQGRLVGINDNKGISLIAVNNEKGRHFLQDSSKYIYLDSVDEKMALKSCYHMAHSPVLYKSQEAFVQMIQTLDFQTAAAVCSNFGPVIKAVELCKIIGNNKEYVLNTFWKDAEELIYILDEKKRLEGIVTYGRFIENYTKIDEWVNYDFKKVIISEKCEEEIQKIFESNQRINRIPLVNQNKELLYEVRRNNKKTIPYQLDRAFLNMAMSYEEIFGKKPLMVISEFDQWKEENIDTYKFVVDSVHKRDILQKKNGLNSIYGGDYFREIKSIVPFLQLCVMGVETYFIRRPALLSDYSYTESEKERMSRGETFPILSEDITLNEDVLKALFKEKFSYEYVMELRQVPQMVEKNGRYPHIDYTSKYINVSGGERKTSCQPEKYYSTVHMYGRCGVFGYAVEDADTLPSVLQRLFNEAGSEIRIVNHGLWGADDEKILHNLFLDIIDGFIKQGDKVVIYMEYLSNMELLEDLNIHIFDSTIPFHRFIKDRAVFYDRPGHMTAEGYQYIAELIYQELEYPVIMGENRKNQQRLQKFISSYISFFGEKSEDKIGIDKIELEKYLAEIENKAFNIDFSDKKNGAIIMNCNPFTRGHRYLIEIAAKEVEILLIFVLEEDKSLFRFQDRFQMVKDGTEDLKNVYVFASGKFMISSLTFPEYFIKEQMQNVKINPVADVQMFAKYIAPRFNVSIRFVGTEPKDKVTEQYNRSLKELLPAYGIQLIEIPRRECMGKVITATEVRKLLKEGRYEKLKSLVPDTTYEYLRNHGFLKERNIVDEKTVNAF